MSFHQQHSVQVFGSNYAEIYADAHGKLSSFFGELEWSMVSLETEAIVTVAGQVLGWHGTAIGRVGG